MEKILKQPGLSLLAILMLLYLNSPVHSQNSAENTRGSSSLFAQAGGPEVVGLHVNHNINKRIAIDAGLGVLLDAHIGLNGYLMDRDKKRTSLFLGLQFASIRRNSFLDVFNSDTTERQFGVYVPIGIEYTAPRGFTMQLDIGPNFVGEDFVQINTEPIMASLKIGYTFKKKRY